MIPPTLAGRVHRGLLLSILTAATLSAQGILATGGFVIGDSPRMPQRDSSLWGQGWTLGTGAEVPLVMGLHAVLEPRFTRITEKGATSKTRELVASLALPMGGSDQAGGFLIGLAREWEALEGSQPLHRQRTWAKVALRTPGFLFPLPGAVPWRFDAGSLRPFTRLEFSRALAQTRRTNAWQFNWSLGLRMNLFLD